MINADWLSNSGLIVKPSWTPFLSFAGNTVVSEVVSGGSTG